MILMLTWAPFLLHTHCKLNHRDRKNPNKALRYRGHGTLCQSTVQVIFRNSGIQKNSSKEVTESQDSQGGNEYLETMLSPVLPRAGPTRAGCSVRAGRSRLWSSCVLGVSKDADSISKLAEKIVPVFGYPQSCEKEEFFLLSAWTFWFVLICVPCLLFIHWIPLRNVWLSILNTLPPSIFTQDKDFPIVSCSSGRAVLVLSVSCIAGASVPSLF